VTKSLGTVGKGAGILFIGTILGIAFQFLSRVVIARFYTPEHYGLYNLSFVVLSIFIAIGNLGLTNGIQRFIAYYTGSDEKQKIKAVEVSGLSIGVASGIFFGAILYFIAPLIAPIFSEQTVFTDYLRIAAFILPFSILLSALISVFRGHKRTKEKVLFREIGKKTIFLILATVLGILALPFVTVIWAMFIATASMAISLFIHYLKKQKTFLDTGDFFSFNPKIAKTILIFSLPLILVNIMYNVMGWADTMMIGYYLLESDVGYYNVAKPMSHMISTFLSVIIFIYSPIVASLYAQKKFKENDVIYSVITKWLCFLTLPIAIVLFFFAEVMILVFFGTEYIPAVIPLQIFAIVYFINNFLGPNGATLTAYGKTKFLMYATSAAAGLNVLLNIILIPIYGIIGAAIATGLSMTSINMIRVKKLYSISGVHPFKSEIFKPLLPTIILGLFIVMPLKLIPIPGVLQAVIAYPLLSGVFLLMVLITRSISKEDLRLLKMVEKRIGIDLSFLKKILKRFV